MLFVNIGQASIILTIFSLLIILIIFTLIRQKQVIRFFFSEEQVHLLSEQKIKYIKQIKIFLLILAIIMIAISLLDPRGHSLSSDIALEGIDVVLTFDISRSMDAQDVLPSRLELAKNLGAQLIDSLVGNRVGLVVFAANALRILPLTTDISTVNLFMQDLSTDMISSQSTDIGKALEESLKTFSEDTLTHKVIILFTDGENLDGNIDKALAHIKKQGVSLLIVGTGTSKGGYIPIINKNGTTVHLKDLLNKDIITKLDEISLKQLAEKSGGTYIIGTVSTIEIFNNIIENMEKNPLGNNTQNFLEPKFRIFILTALIALLLILFLPEKKIRSGAFILLLALNQPIHGITAERKAYEAFKKEEYSTALRYYQRSLLKNAKNIKAKFGEAATLYKLERYDRAEKYFLELSKSGHKKICTQSLFNEANAHAQNKNYKKALELYKQVMQTTSNNSKLFKKSLNNFLLILSAKEQQDNHSEKNKEEEIKDKEKNNENNGSKASEKESYNSQSESITSNDLDNLLSMAEDSEKENFHRQNKKEKKGILKQNKW